MRATLGAGLAVLSMAGGCAVSTQSTAGGFVTQTAVRDRNHTYYEQAHADFARALFYKPRDGIFDGPSFDLAPLIVQEVACGPSQALRFGAVEEAGEGRARVNAELPAVYVESGRTEVGWRWYDTLTYRWFYSIDAPHGPSIVEKAHRILLGADGFPLVHETVSVDGSITIGVRTLFVSASFELAAAAKHGPVLEGRRFAAERSIEDAPQTIIVSVLEDGPLPMGPYVYISVPSGRVTTLLCRCSPSQMDEVIESAYYDLVPFDRVRSLLARAPFPAAQTGTDRVDALLDRPLDKVLRWPD